MSKQKHAFLQLINFYANYRFIALFSYLLTDAVKEHSSPYDNFHTDMHI